jgi:hypothetical protein
MSQITYKDITKRNNIEIITKRINSDGSFLIKENSELFNCTGKALFSINKVKREFNSKNKISSEDINNFLENRIISDPLLIELIDSRTGSKSFYKITELFKDSELGGKGAGASTAKEDAQLKSLQVQIKNAILESNSSFITVKCNNKKYDIIGAESTRGTPKSDFHLLDKNGDACIWISHKDGRSPTDFQNWGGVSKKEYPTTPDNVQKFVDKIKSMYGEKLSPAVTAASEIYSKDLKNMAVYGKDFKSRRLGEQNVSILLQGEVKLIKKGQHYELSAYHIHQNGDKLTGNYEPILSVVYKGGSRKDFGINGARFGIMPIGSRKIKQWIDIEK